MAAVTADPPNANMARTRAAAASQREVTSLSPLVVTSEVLGARPLARMRRKLLQSSAEQCSQVHVHVICGERDCVVPFNPLVSRNATRLDSPRPVIAIGHYGVSRPGSRAGRHHEIVDEPIVLNPRPRMVHFFMPLTRGLAAAKWIHFQEAAGFFARRSSVEQSNQHLVCAASLGSFRIICLPITKF